MSITYNFSGVTYSLSGVTHCWLHAFQTTMCGLDASQVPKTDFTTLNHSTTDCAGCVVALMQEDVGTAEGAERNSGGKS